MFPDCTFLDKSIQFRAGILYFNPLAPRGARRHTCEPFSLSHLFQSTRPAWGETLYSQSHHGLPLYFNPLAPCGARRAVLWTLIRLLHFNPLAPCGARRPGGQTSRLHPPTFQSTRPVRGETATPASTMRGSTSFQSTRPVRGETARSSTASPMYCSFQSTRPVRGETALLLALPLHLASFQSTRPVRGETGKGVLLEPIYNISIHAPRAGRDAAEIDGVYNRLKFQSTRPVRGETQQ